MKDDANKAKKDQTQAPDAQKPAQSPKEIGGREGLDPVRYGDWEINGKCVDF